MNVQDLLHQAAALIRSGQFDAALPHLREANRLQPGSPDVLNNLGAALEQLGQVEEAVAFSPDGKAVLIGSADKTARLWSAATGKELTPPLRHRGPVRAVAFSPDGKAVLTGSADNTARLWQRPVAVKGDVIRIKLWTQVVTGMEMDDKGDLHVLDAPTWQRRRNQLMDLGGALDLPTDGLLWHRCQATDAEIGGQWYAAAWHLSRLIKAEPGDAAFRQRRGWARGELGQWAKASEDFARAVQGTDAQVGDWAGHATLRLHLGDTKGYRQTCAHLLKNIGRKKDPQTTN
jgi:hypothetical protein